MVPRQAFRGDGMIGGAWDRYRGWAKRSRELQSAGERAKLIALVAAVAAAVLGAVATLEPKDSTIGKVLAFLAAGAAAVAAILGRELLSAANETKWVRARATAEAIKSECFLAAARAGQYSGPDAAARFEGQLNAFEGETLSAGVTPLQDPGLDDGRRPPEPDGETPLTVEGYRKLRLQNQRDWFAANARRHQRAAALLRDLGIGAAIVAALLGIAAGAGQAWLAPWIGTVTTVAAAIAAWGLMDRRNYLVVSYEGMAHRLSVLDGSSGSRTLPVLVTEGEELLRSEHTAWARRMSQPAAAPPGPGGGVSPAKPSGAAA